MCLITAVFSSFVNDTPVFCIMLPIVLTWCASGAAAGVNGRLRGADGGASLRVIRTLQLLLHHFERHCVTKYLPAIILCRAAKARLPIRQLLIPLTYCCLVGGPPCLGVKSSSPVAPSLHILRMPL